MILHTTAFDNAGGRRVLLLTGCSKPEIVCGAICCAKVVGSVVAQIVCSLPAGYVYTRGES